MSKLIELDTLDQLWAESTRIERSEIVYLLQTRGISQAKIAQFANATPRNVKSRKHDSNSYILAGTIPSGMFDLQLEYSEIVESEMDRRDRLQVNKHARNAITNTVLAQDILDQVTALAREAGDRHQLSNSYTKYRGPIIETVGEESALMHISDLHFCRKIPNVMDETSVRDALFRYAKNSLNIIERQRMHTNIKKLYVVLNGDNIHGLHNFLSQTRETTGSLSYQITQGAWLFIELINFLSKHFEEIEIVITGGNHGKITPRDDLMTENAEFVMGQIIAAYYSGFKNIKCSVAYGSFYHILDVLGQKVFITHGDQISGGGDPTAIINAVKRWDSTGTIPPFDTVLMGHFHRSMKLPLPSRYGSNKGRSIYVGGTASKDDKFLEGLGSTPSLQYWLLFFSAKRVTSSYEMDLYDR